VPVNAVFASEQKVTERNVCVEGTLADELDKKNSVFYVIDGFPDHHKGISHLRPFLKECAHIPDQAYEIGKCFSRGGVSIRLRNRYARRRDLMQEPERLVTKRLLDPTTAAKKEVIVYQVPLWFALENVEDRFWIKSF